jgi:hypothetical protein
MNKTYPLDFIINLPKKLKLSMNYLSKSQFELKMRLILHFKNFVLLRIDEIRIRKA